MINTIMILYKSINLHCYNQLLEYCREFISSSKLFNSDNDYCEFHEFPSDLKNILDHEMTAKGLGVSAVPLYFYKSRMIHPNPNHTHIDAINIGDKNIITNTSLILPITGCHNTKHYWYNGQYKLVFSYTENGVPHQKIQWLDTPVLIDEVEISDNPLLCNVSIPHHAYSNGIERRATCTVRFKNNLKLESLDDEKLLS